MGTPLRGRQLVSVISLLELVFITSNVASASISNSLSQFVSQQIFRVAGLEFPNIAGEVTQRLALGSIQLPVPANSTSFIYSWNEGIAPERSPGSLGPVFVDRAETIGESKFDLLLSYQFANLTDFDGTNFGPQLQFAARGDLNGTRVVGAFVGKDFSLEENLFVFNATYGLTKLWDVNLLVPILYTTLDLDGVTFSPEGAPTPERARFHDQAFGIGDILLRTKYRFYDDPNVVLLGGALTLRMPSGNPDNFQGLGDFTITPTLIASHPIGRNDIHMNLAMDFDTMNGERTRARYAVGTTIQPWDRLAFLIDILGSSGLDDEHFSLPTTNVTSLCGPGPFRGLSTICKKYSVSNGNVNAVVPRSDIVDISTGIKFNPFGSASVYLVATIPLTHQGLRAPVLPAGGFEWTF